MNDHAPRPAPANPPGRVAAIDYGTVRIGIAVSDRARSIASPLAVYTRRGAKLDAEYFRTLARQEELAEFVVGLPVHLSGEESQKSHEARQFGAWLAETTGLPVAYFDERFTSAEADRMLSTGKLTKKRRQARRDMLAAQILLTAYLAGGGRSQPNPGSLG